MKPRQRLQISVVTALLLVGNVQAAERFVSLGGGHVASFTSWADAATNIQAAIDAAANGDVVTVSNGVYALGGKVMAGDLTNRIAVDKPILVRSVNGPYQTIIQGAWDPTFTNGAAAVRCAWLTNGATLSGFTLRGGATRRGNNTILSTSTNSGGGVWSASTGSLVTNCVITGNAADYTGGGAFSNTVVNSTLVGNVVVVHSTGGTISGGGAQECILKNCAILGNQILSPSLSTYGGGAYRGALTNCLVAENYAYYAGIYGSQTPVMNCILWSNTSVSAAAAAAATNYSGNELIRYSCSMPLPSGTGNIASDPQLLSDGIHLSPTSPCRGAGSALYATGSDIDGQAWSNPPSMGCDEWVAAPVIILPITVMPGPFGQLQLSTAAVGEEPLISTWMKDGVALAGARFGGLGTTRLLINGFGPDDAGSYVVIVSNAAGSATSQVAQVVVRCVSLAASAPATPYTNWLMAATNIQTAIDAAAAGDIVLVTNGVYNTGGKVMAGDLTNRVAVDKAVIVMSVNGATNTTIEATPGYGGTSSSGNANGPGAIRAVWLGEGATLSGFTLRGGGTRVSSTSSGVATNSGGGVWCASPNALVTYCDIVENSAYYQGGGAFGGSFANCKLLMNDAGQQSGGQYSSFASGGGAGSSILNNCLLKWNRAGGAGGGANGGTLNHCTIIGNSVYAGVGTGAKDSVVRNCILWNNSGEVLNNYSGSTIFYSCSPYVAAGNGNITNNPLFLADGVHLSSSSPCRSAGNASYASGADCDGQAWTNPPSMGCDEWWPQPLLLSFRKQANSWGQFDFVTYFAGIESSPGYWFKDGAAISVSSHYPVAEATHLTVKGISASDTGQYQLVVSNAFGTATSRVANVVVHFVNAGNPGAQAPFTNWATAAGNIQDAIDAAAADAVVLVTNGIYNSGGNKFLSWSVTNRVTVDKQAAVVSANGPGPTIIEGRWDPVSTLGTNAVRCVLLWSNSSLAGFTLRNGATEANGQGGGISVYWDELVSSCILSNNRADLGGGGAWGTYYDCWFVKNSASSGGATFRGNLSSCAVVENSAASYGGGILSASLTNCIVWHNSAPYYPDVNYLTCTYSCSPTLANSSGNISSNPQLVDGLHLAATSPCRGAGATSLFNAVDLDGDPWLTPPSMGCDEFAAAGMVGPLAASIEASATNTLMNRSVALVGRISGRASGLEWSYGDGPSVTNVGYFTTHTWTNAGDYTVSFRCFNSDYPDGVATNLLIHVDPVFPPVLAAASVASGTNFLFQFSGQAGANYSVEYATNLAAPIAWRTLKSLTSNGGVVQITDTAATNAARFYRVKAQ